jgi:alpha-1,3-glucosyltransferase
LLFVKQLIMLPRPAPSPCCGDAGRAVQVHEKSILLPLLPITMLAAQEPDLAIWGPVVAAFSMYPLLVRDGVAAAYAASIVLYVTVMTGLAAQKGIGAVTVLNTKAAVLAALGCLCAVVLHLLQLFVPPPEGLPWLHDRLFISYGFVFIAAAMLYTNVQQYKQQQAKSRNDKVA